MSDHDPADRLSKDDAKLVIKSILDVEREEADQPRGDKENEDG